MLSLPDGFSDGTHFCLFLHCCVKSHLHLLNISPRTSMQFHASHVSISAKPIVNYFFQYNLSSAISPAIVSAFPTVSPSEKHQIALKKFRHPPDTIPLHCNQAMRQRFFREMPEKFWKKRRFGGEKASFKRLSPLQDFSPTRFLLL